MGKNIYKHTDSNGREYYNDSQFSDEEKVWFFTFLLPFAPGICALLSIIYSLFCGFSGWGILIILISIALQFFVLNLLSKEKTGVAMIIGFVYAALFFFWLCGKL